ncbi:MAG: hypothetical protein GX614_12065 [Sandaracinaceae bacterium]|nr:hypothetical protein [Sandaracinaceae bacterium]
MRIGLNFIVFFALSGFALMGCGGGAPGEGFQICGPDAKLPTDPFRLDAAKIVGDELHVDVGYGGGCKAHEFTLCWDGSFAESHPVQARLSLHHEANGDGCDAYISETRSFDLSELRSAYVDGYQTEEGAISITLTGGEPAGTFLYEF